MESIGAGTVQKLRSELRGKAKIKVAKNTLIKKHLIWLKIYLVQKIYLKELKDQ